MRYWKVLIGPACFWLALHPALAAGRKADLVLLNGTVWTVDDARPTAEAVAISGNIISAVGSNDVIRRMAGPRTRIIDLKGAFLMPSFIDAHTHFGNAVDAFFTARVIDVGEQDKLDRRLREAAARVPGGMWITATDLDGKAAAKASRSHKAHDPFVPDLAAVDAASGNHPILIRRYDGAWFANSQALKLGRITPDTPDPPNGEYVHDPRTGKLTGLMLGSAGARFNLMLPPPSAARNMLAAQAIVHHLNAMGITGIQDISRIDALSQKMLFPVAVERSFTDMNIFYDLRKTRQLSVRVYPILSLAEWRSYASAGIFPGAGDDLIHYGALKAFIDTMFMQQPFNDKPHFRGDFSFRVTDPDALQADMIGAAKLGFDIASHVIGDEGHEILLHDYDRAIAASGLVDRRFRLIHMYYPNTSQLERAGQAHDIADITPYQMVDDGKETDEELGLTRAKTAFAWRTAIRDGIRLDIGSDWPGSFDGNTLFPNNPLENIFYAVTRRELDDKPGSGWHPDEALTVDEAIRAYTINPAFAERREKRKGSITPGKLADMVVLSRNIRTINPGEIPKTRVLTTVFNGKIIYQSGAVPEADAR